MRTSLITVCLLAASLPLSPARGGEVDVSAILELQLRLFPNDAAWSGQTGGRTQGSVVSTTELRWCGSDQRASLIPVLRWDENDNERSLADLKEAYWAIQGDDVELLIGANTEFWGVTESVHLVDIINQTDFAADIDGEQKLGQPMVNVALQRDWGLLSAYVMPYFRDRTFTGIDGRFRPGLPVDGDDPLYESTSGNKHVDVALRYSHYIGDVDIGLSAFSGTSREPRLVPSSNGQSLRPIYDQIDQIGLDLQYTHDAWLWKLEAIARDAFSESFVAAVAGLEYTVYQVKDSAVDMGLLVELQYDGRNELEPLTIADNDVFLATRLALNDTQDTTLLAGVAYDTDTGATLVNIEAERRIGHSWFVELRARVFSGAERGDTSYAFAKDDYMQFNIARYF